jgi:signal transduction histidine kinase
MPFELAGLLAEIDGLLSTQARAKHIRFVLDAEPSLPAAVSRRSSAPVAGAAESRQQRGEVHRPRRGATGRASACRTRRALSIEFAVHDTGIGIGQGSMTRLFMPFGQVTDGRPHRGGGTGLGLVISQKLVRLMGGEDHGRE